jgi:ATP-dependent Clp protease ATP-binding subunit ClpC
MFVQTFSYRLPIKPNYKVKRKTNIRCETDSEFLKKYTVNLTKVAKENHSFHPIIGRSKEMESMYNVLLKRTKRNPLLVGDAGVGKTALVEELARCIATDTTINHQLSESEILQLDVAGLMAGTKVRGEIEERVSKLIQILTNTENEKNLILFIDEIHILIKSNSKKLADDPANTEIGIAEMLKPVLARGNIQCIGSTTRNEYIKYFKNDSAFDRRFQYIEINEPDIESTLQMLDVIKTVYEDFHKCKITKDALHLAVSLSDQYIPYRNFPDKAIDLIDEACSRVVLSSFKHNIPRIVDKIDVQKIIELITDLDVNFIAQTENQKILNIKSKLESKIIGQSHAINEVIKTLMRHSCGMYRKNRPICSMLFAGPTGVGKTELTKLVADGYYGSNTKLLRFDMSEYMEGFSISTLIGSPPGYQGFDEGGKLTKAIKETPCAVVLFDELEKAHSDVLNLLLQILEDGILTDSYGNTYSFRNAIIIMTTNVTTQSDVNTLGFETNTMKTKNTDILKTVFRPELLNRIDTIVEFNSLYTNDLQQICEICLNDALTRVPDYIQVHVSDSTKDELLKMASVQTEYGARPVKRLIEELVMNPLSDILLRGVDELDKIVI